MADAVTLPAVQPRPWLLPYQARWVEDTSRVAIAVKSRQIGLSWCTAWWATMRAGLLGETVYVAVYSADPRREWIADVVEWAEQTGQVFSLPSEQWVRDPGGDYQITRVRFASGGSVVALPALERALRGRRGHMVIDEAAYADHLARLVDACTAQRMWGHRLRLICTQPRPGAASWAGWYDLLSRAEVTPGWRLHTIPLADALTDGLYRRIAERNGQPATPDGEAKWELELRQDVGPAAAQELDCIPGQAEGAYLSPELVAARSVPCPIERWAWTADEAIAPAAVQEARMKRWLDSRLPQYLPSEHGRRYLGWDVATDPAGDPIVGVVLQHEPDGDARPLLMVEFRGLPDDRQRQVIEWLWKRMPLRGLAIDATGVGQSLGRWAVQRWPGRAKAVSITRAWYGDALPAYRDALEQDVQSVPDHPDVRDDHRMVIVKDGLPRIGPERTVGSDGRQRHGDSVIALLMARHVMPRRRSRPSFRFDSRVRV